MGSATPLVGMCTGYELFTGPQLTTERQQLLTAIGFPQIAAFQPTDMEGCRPRRTLTASTTTSAAWQRQPLPSARAVS